MERGPLCSEWAKTTFGQELAHELLKRVPSAMKVAVDRQIRTQDASELDCFYAYGGAWKVQFDELVFHCRDLPGVKFMRPYGRPFELVVANGRALMPFRYANDRVTRRTDPSVWKRLNRTTRELLVERGPRPVHQQLELISDLLPDNVAGGHVQGFTSLTEVDLEGVVLVCFAANARDGLLEVGWGEAAVERDTLQWPHYESLTVPVATTSHSEQGTVDEQKEVSVSRKVLRFDEAPMPSAAIAVRHGSERLHSGPIVGEEVTYLPNAGDAQT